MNSRRPYSKTHHDLRMWKFNLTIARYQKICFLALESKRNDGLSSTSLSSFFSRNKKVIFTTKLYLAHRKTGRPNWKPVRQIRKPVNPIWRPANMLFFISCNFEVKNVVVKNMERLRNIIVIDFRHKRFRRFNSTVLWGHMYKPLP